MNTTKMTTYFVIDFFKRTITGTKTSFRKAGKGFGPEYEELAAKLAAHPDFQLVVKEPKHRSNKPKRTYDGLDFKFMERYIKTLPDAEQVMKEYNAVKDMAEKTETPKYPMTKKWFLKKFSTESKPFDMEEAQKAVSDFNISEAQKIATSATNEESNCQMKMAG